MAMLKSMFYLLAFLPSALQAEGKSVAPDTIQNGTDTRHAGISPDEDLVTAGLAVYGKQYCGTCHVLDTAGSTGAFGPTHNGMAAIAAQRVRNPNFTGSASTAEEYILESIVDPTVYVVSGYERSRSRMPAYGNLSEVEIGALVNLLLQER